MMYICKVCNSKKVNILNVEEKYYGTFEKFEYLHCLECGSLTIIDIPDDLSKYYPVGYYSFRDNALPSSFQDKGLLSSLTTWVRKQYWQYIISKEPRNIVGYIIEIFKKQPDKHILKIIHKTNINPKSKIIDIGCGSGSLLRELRQFGYDNVIGIDPNIENDLFYDNEKFVLKSTIEDYSKEASCFYDLIMFNHSFEHIPNPKEVLLSIKKLSHDNTTFLIRIPLASSYAFEHYRENWVQLDAPRHLFLYSEQGFRITLENNGFEILDVVYDSNEVQFWGSEQYMQNIPLISEKSFSVSLTNSIFSQEQILDFKEKAKKLNKEKKGDMAAFIFKLKNN